MPKYYKATRKYGLGWKNAKSNPIEISNFPQGYMEVIEPLLD